MVDIESEQKAICSKYGADYVPPTSWSKIGVAEDLRSGRLPINGIRHVPVGDTNGWYLWAGGEPSQRQAYFQPLHMEHIDEWYPGLMKFMALAPGWRFQVAPNYEDVWFDSSLIME